MAFQSSHVLPLDGVEATSVANKVFLVPLFLLTRKLNTFISGRFRVTGVSYFSLFTNYHEVS